MNLKIYILNWNLSFSLFFINPFVKTVKPSVLVGLAVLTVAGGTVLISHWRPAS
jgi:hypothetical protein